jgi:hypothetical protein
VFKLKYASESYRVCSDDSRYLWNHPNKSDLGDTDEIEDLETEEDKKIIMFIDSQPVAVDYHCVDNHESFRNS